MTPLRLLPLLGGLAVLLVGVALAPAPAPLSAPTATTLAPAISPLGPAAPVADDELPGYTDTPFLPGGVWRVHDAHRPPPPVVSPGRDGSPPSDALVLFDGHDLAAWTDAEGDEPRWSIVGGALQVAGTGDIQTREAFGDIQLHLEWATPDPPSGEGQGRGNSGVFLMGRYEVQLLDSFENRTYADGQAAALYGQFPPQVNACRGPGRWQSYEILFRAPRFQDGELRSPAVVTVLHNGVLVHHGQPFLGRTVHRKLASYEAHAASEPIRLQNHGDPLRYRNIWVRRLDTE